MQKNAKERIKIICCHLGIQGQELAQEINLERQTIYNIKENISEPVARKIAEKYPQFRYEWLLTGEEPMLRTEIQHNEQQNVSIGGDNIVNGSSKTTSEGLLAVMELVMSQQKTIQDLTEQNKMLTRMIAER